VAYLTNPLQIDTPSLASFSILLIMSAASTALSISFYLKSRATNRLPKNLRASVFYRTFNVFDPFPDKRRIFHSYLFFLVFSPLVAFSWTFILVFIVILRVFQAGLITALILFATCLNLMMIGEASEIYQNASRLLKAVKSGTPLGRGDLAILRIIKKTLRKLGAYYLILAALFAASFYAAPYVFPLFLMAFASIVGAITTAAVSTVFFAPVFAVLMFTGVMVTVFVVARKVETVVFNFPPSDKVASATSAGVRAGLTRENLDRIMDSEPDEMTW